MCAISLYKCQNSLDTILLLAFMLGCKISTPDLSIGRVKNTSVYHCSLFTLVCVKHSLMLLCVTCGKFFLAGGRLHPPTGSLHHVHHLPQQISASTWQTVNKGDSGRQEQRKLLVSSSADL